MIIKNKTVEYFNTPQAAYDRLNYLRTQKSVYGLVCCSESEYLCELVYYYMIDDGVSDLTEIQGEYNARERTRAIVRSMKRTENARAIQRGKRGSMTNHEAIQFLDNMKHEEAGRAIGNDGFYTELMGYHVEALNMAIKALEQRWIPVSERLPDKNMNCFVTLENGVVKVLGYSTTQRTTYPKGFYYVEDGISWRQTQNPVVAWMPLPLPWKGE